MTFVGLILLVLHLPLPLWAEDLCTPYDLRKPGEALHGIPVRNQHGGVCFATAAAQALDARWNLKDKSQTPWISSDLDVAFDTTHMSVMAYEFADIGTLAPSTEKAPAQAPNICTTRRLEEEEFLNQFSEPQILQPLRETLNWRTVPPPEEHWLSFEGGFFCDAIAAAQFSGVCSESFRLQTLRREVIEEQKQWLIESFATVYSPRKVALQIPTDGWSFHHEGRVLPPRTISTMAFNIADCAFGKDKPQASMDFLRQAFSLKRWGNELALKTLREQCPAQQRRKIEPAVSCLDLPLSFLWQKALANAICNRRKTNLREEIKKAQAQAEELINLGINNSQPKLPVGVTYYSSILESNANGEETPNGLLHASLIIGRRQVAGKCQYLVRNSWGKDCARYPNPKIQNACEGGDIWFNATDLAPKVVSVSVIK